MILCFEGMGLAPPPRGGERGAGERGGGGTTGAGRSPANDPPGCACGALVRGLLVCLFGDGTSLFGVTTLDITRARTFVAALKKLDVNTLKVPVVGGHAGTTILPLLSQNSAGVTFTQEELEALTKRIQFGGDEVVEAKAGAGSATLSMAYAGAEFAFQVIHGLNNNPNVVECTFVESKVTDAPFFASKVQLGPNGVEKIHGLGTLTAFEQKKLAEMLPELKKSIEKGIAFAKGA